MYGYYSSDITQGQMPAPSLAAATAWGGGPRAAVTGGRWLLQNVNGFLEVRMAAPAATGWVSGQGVKTEGLSGCIVIAAMQRDEDGAWQRYYFAHLLASEWEDRAVERSQEFRDGITHPDRAFLLLVNQGLVTSESIVRAVQQWGISPIPDNRTTVYEYVKVPASFAMRFQDAAVGEF